MERNVLWIIALTCFGVIEGAPNQGLVIATWYPATLVKSEGPIPPGSTPLSGNTYNISQSVEEITCIDSDYRNSTLFIADSLTGGIYKITDFNFGTNDPLDISVVQTGLSPSIIQIAFDVTTNNLYWVDAFYNWIAMKPAYSQDSTDYKVIIENDLQEPEGLAIDPYNWYIFFTDTWNNTRIERATLAGEERRVIVHSGVVWIFSLTVDSVSKTLYWADYSKSSLESSDYDGNSRRVISKKEGLEWTAIDYHNGFLYAVSYYAATAYRFDVSTNAIISNLSHTSEGNPFAIHYFDNETFVDFNNTCNYKACSDMCVNTKSGPKCICRQGSVLQSDSITCTAPTGFFGKGLLFSNSTSVCMLEIQIINRLKNSTVPCIDIPDVNITSIAADVANHRIFYLDSSNNSLMEYDIISQKNTYLTSVVDASCLVYDWINGILLWIEKSSRKIKAYTRTTKYVTTLYTSTTAISNLTADSHSRKLFWLSGNVGSENIMVGDLHGGNSNVLVSSTILHRPSLLYFDITSHRLFWVSDSEVTSALPDGTGVLHYTWINHDTSHFLIYKDFAIWIQNGVFYSGHVSSWSAGTADSDIFKDYGNISSLFVYDIAVQKPEAGPCEIMNGGCEEICLPGDGVPICKCDIGLSLHDDNKTCTSQPLMTDFVMVTDYHHGNALQVSLTNGSIRNIHVHMYSPTASTFDKSRNEFVWFEYYQPFVYSLNIYDEENSTPPVAIYGAVITGMDIDYSTGNLYFIANYYGGDGFIGVVHRLSTRYNTLISPYDETGDIKLYPSKGLLFSSEYGSYGSIIARANMDGSDYRDLIVTDIVKPMGLAVDYKDDLLYWVDNSLHKIERCDFTGGNRYVISIVETQPAFVDVFENYLFYTAWDRQRILKINKNTGTPVNFMSDNPELGSLDDITVVPGEAQPINSLCSVRNGNCSTLCLPTPSGRVCACDDLDHLLGDGTTCSDVPKCSLAVPNGKMESLCLPYPGQTCNYTCNSGYIRNNNTDSLECGPDGEWSQDLFLLCIRNSNQGMVIASWNPARIWKSGENLHTGSSSVSGYLYNLSPEAAQITSMDSDFSNSTLFLSEGLTGGIYKITNFVFDTPHRLDISVVHAGVSQAFIHLAFDPNTKNLYWTDAYYNWIAMKPAYSQDSTDYKVMIEQDLRNPEGLTIDPYNGYMFFVDSWNNTRIERATLAGQERRVIIHTGLLRIFSMTVDHTSRTLYWGDYSRHTIESANYDGGNRTIITKRNERDWTSIDFHAGYLYAVSYYSEKIYVVDAATKDIARSLTYSIQGNPFAIHYFNNKFSVAFNNTCNNKGCSDMCVHTPSGPTCVCKEGSVLQNDSVTCTAPTEFYGKGILFSNATAVCMLEIQILTKNNNDNPVPCVNISDAKIASIAADVANHVIFYIDSNNNSLMEFDIISQKITYLTSVDDASYLVYDWIDGILLWIEKSSRQIKAYTRATKYVVTLYTSAPVISHLTADSHSRNLYFLSGTKGFESIMIGDLQGGNIRTLISTDSLHQPNFLYFDITSHRLFWVSSTQVTSALSDGTDVQYHNFASSAFSQFLIYKDFAVWVKDNIIYAQHTSNWNQVAADYEVLQGYGFISSLFVYDVIVQKPEAGPCEIMNGGCEEICLPGDGVPVCKCDIGLQLQADNKTCTSERLMSDFVIVTDFPHGRALQISLTNGSLTNVDVHMNYPTASTFDKSRNELVWFEYYEQLIYSFNIYGNANSTSEVPIYGAEIVGMDIDYSTGNLYFIANYFGEGFIGVVHRLSTRYKTLISPYDEMGDIVLDPSEGYMFSSEYGQFGSIISRARMDGSDYTEIITDDVIKPMGLAIDFSAKLLYWADNSLHKIERCDFNGDNRHVLPDIKQQPAYLELYANFLLYTSWTSQKIQRVSTVSEEHSDFMSDNPELGRLDGITAVPGIPHPIHSICAKRNGNCSTLCLPTSPTSRVCGCDDLDHLLDDGRTCSDVFQCPNLVLGKVHPDCLRYPMETCNYTCNPGYVKNSSIDTLDCGRYGIWEQDLTTVCLVGPPTTTPEPPPTTTPELLCPNSLWNGTLSKTCTRKPNTVCPFTCNPGYPAKNGLTSLACNSQGSWNHDTTNICQPNVCPNNVLNGDFKKSCNRYPNTRCQFDCDAGFRRLAGVISLHCGYQGTWDKDVNSLCIEILCPTTVVNGNLTSTCPRRPDTACPLQCAPGYKAPMGVTSLFCDYNGQWNYNTSTVCEPMKCLNNVTNGQLGTGCSRDPNTTCSVSCNNKYRPVGGVSSLTCGFDGNWNKNVSTICKQINCGNVTKEVQLQADCATVSGSQCTYDCAAGYRRNTSVTSLTCQNTGKWNINPAGLCTEITCPQNIPNSEAVVTDCSKKVKSKCKYICTNGYTRNMALSFVTCLESGNWDNATLPLCLAIKPGTSKQNQSSDVGSVAGISVGALVVILIVILVGVFCLRKQQTTEKSERQRIVSFSEDRASNFSINNMSFEGGMYDEIGPDADGTLRDISHMGFQNPQYDYFSGKGQTTQVTFDPVQGKQVAPSGDAGFAETSLQYPEKGGHGLDKVGRESVANDYSMMQPPHSGDIPWGRVDPETDNTINDQKSKDNETSDGADFHFTKFEVKFP